MDSAQMPPEILFEIASSCRLRDVETLGATCHMMRALARDDHLWRGLFARDFAHLYAVETPAATLPQDVVGYDDQWPDFALEACAAVHGSADTLPPRGSSDDRIPTPFVHMTAMGKDWRWLCVAHACRISGRGSLLENPIVCPRALLPTPFYPYGGDACSFEYVGDAIAGRRHGYGVQLRTLDGVVIEWIAGLWANDVVCGWCVRSDAQRYISGFASNGAWQGLAFHVVRRIKRGFWGGVTPAGDVAGEPWVVVAANGVRRCYVAGADGDTVIERLWEPGCSSAEFICDKQRRRHGRGTTRLCNGDVIVHEWLLGDLVAIVEFMCSLSCPVPEFAGRRLGVDRRWTLERVLLSDGSYDLAYWIVDDGSKDERLFWRYVAEGLIGWKKEVRAHALGSRPARMVVDQTNAH